MNKGENERGSRYQLRFAAGVYWILDMWQEGMPYKKPLAVNEIGADIWRLLEQGKSDEEIASILSREYNAEQSMIAEDIVRFWETLSISGICIQR